MAIRTDCLRWFGVKAACLLRLRTLTMETSMATFAVGDLQNLKGHHHYFFYCLFEIGQGNDHRISGNPFGVAASSASCNSTSGELPKWLRVVSRHCVGRHKGVGARLGLHGVWCFGAKCGTCHAAQGTCDTAQGSCKACGWSCNALGAITFTFAEKACGKGSTD